MLGKLSSVGAVVERLRRGGCANWAVKEFVQGGKTRRWGVAWSWGGWRPRVGVARGLSGRVSKKVGMESGKAGVKKESHEEQEAAMLEGGLLPFPSEFEFEILHQTDLDEIGKRINSEIRRLDLQWQWKATLGIGLGIASDGDCWSRKARRKKKTNPKTMQGDDEDHDEDEYMHDDADDDADEDKEPALVFKIHLRRMAEKEREPGDENPSKEVEAEADPEIETKTKTKTKADAEPVKLLVNIRWLQGHDHVLFESFCGWLKRKLATG